MAKRISGKVSSSGQDKTIVITTTNRHTHPLYGKQYTRTRKYIAHDEKNQASVGDMVTIVETRPISRRKHFSLEKITQAGHEGIELKEETLEKVVAKEEKA